MSNTRKASGLKAEAKDEPVSFTYRDRTYTIPRENVEDLELWEAIEDDKVITALRGFLGPEQWAALKDAVRDEQGRVPMTSFNEILDVVMEQVGNSSASPAS